MKEEELTYIFIKYIHTTLVNHAGKYYKEKFNNSHLVPYEETLTEAIMQKSFGAEKQKKIDPAEQFEEKSLYEKVNRTLFTLNNEELAILYMKYFLKKSDREIGSVIGVSSQAVSKRKRKLIKRIQKNI